MPHSSGGGSHSGGSHSSGSHSSHSSRSSGGGSSSGGSHSRRVTSSQPFPGSKRYLYYRDNKPYFVYSNYDVSKKDNSSLVMGIIVFVFFILPALVGPVIGMVVAFEKPKKLTYYHKCPELVIEDNLGIFEDEDALEESMKAFFDTTGIVPAVITVSNDEWKENYTSLENYAYDVYVNRFRDEYHWLLVYSESVKDNGFVDWYWEGMQGDNTDKLLTDKRADAFTESLHTRLLQRDKYSVDTAIAVTLDQYRPELMKVTLDSKLFYICLFIFVLFSLIAWYMFAVAYKPSKVPEVYKNAKLCELTAVYQEPCNYCGGIYIIGMHTTCPHCGAALPAHHYIKDAQGNVVELIQ